MKTSDIKGIIPPVITPMNNDDEQTVNHEALREQVERLLAGGVHGIFPMGTNGEAYALSFQEKEEILATVIDQVKGRVPVYAGTGCITTAETIRLSRRAEELGADALSIITPSFALASQKELYDHYVAVAKQVNIPIILYNIPPRTGNKLLPETVQALCRDVDVIVGAKDSSGDIENLKAYFGFTDTEVKGMLEYYGLSGHYAEVKEWYDGYRFGNVEVYCPWDVINYCDLLRADPNALPQDYWSNTSGNAMVRRFIDKADTQTRDEIERLIAGDEILKEIHQELTYNELDSSIEVMLG